MTQPAIARMNVEYKFGVISFKSLIPTLLLFSPWTLVFFSYGGFYLLEVAIAATISITLLTSDIVFTTSIGSFFSSILAVRFFGVIVIVAGVGFAIHGNASASYAELRANSIVLVGFYVGWLMATQPPSFKEYWLSASLWATILTTIFWFYARSAGLAGFEVKFPFGIFAPALALIILSENGRAFLAFLTLALFGFLTAISSFRSYFIVFAAISLYSVISLVPKLPKSHSIIFVLLTTSLFVAAATSDTAEAFFFDDESRYIQVIGKSEDLLDYLEGRTLGSDSDNLRANYLSYLVTDWVNLLLPHGLGSREYYGKVGSMNDPDANTIDTGALYLVFHYGWILSIVLASCLIKILASTIDRLHLKSLLLLSPLVVMLAVDGSVFTITFKGFWMGVYIGYFLVRAMDERVSGQQATYN